VGERVKAIAVVILAIVVSVLLTVVAGAMWLYLSGASAMLEEAARGGEPNEAVLDFFGGDGFRRNALVMEFVVQPLVSACVGWLVAVLAGSRRAPALAVISLLPLTVAHAMAGPWDIQVLAAAALCLLCGWGVARWWSGRRSQSPAAT
jgi:hypothetical protein